ncbi:MAG TPA: hypothetical protein VMT43_02085 [Acidimicrobiales bacterium]|nr:hypothetical protein [Acidimicrobiales bacterium]
MRRLVVFFALTGMSLFGLGMPGSAQTSTTEATPPQLVVTGKATCLASGSYQLTWSLANSSTTTVEFMGAEMSGASTGPVELAPSVIHQGQSMFGQVTVPGSTKGTVTLKVSTLVGNIGSADYSGAVTLAGDCATQPAQASPGFTG